MKTDNLHTGNAPESGAWVFDKQVTDAFTDMIERSIPGYGAMRDVISRIVLHTNPKRVLDLGASNGESIAPFVENPKVPKDIEYHLYEISKPMLSALSDRYRNNDNVHVHLLDLRQRHHELAARFIKDLNKQGETHQQATHILAILTLIFVPINFRPNVLRAVYESLEPGGVFIMSEKLQGATYLTDNILNDVYHKYKNDMGYSWEAIERKRLSLEGAQVPLSEEVNIKMLHNAGFKHVEVIHRHLNFATFVAIK